MVETKMDEFNIKLWSYELAIRDIEALDEDNLGGGGVSVNLHPTWCHMNTCRHFFILLVIVFFS
jgi:hypothetical protein